MKRAGAYLLVAAALGLVAFRFAQLELASFARDEPQFLAAAREQHRTGRWLSANPLYGNMGRRYGPVAFWFYGGVQLLVGEDPRRAIVAMGLVVTLAQVALALALTRALREDAWFLAVLLAWLASSPYQFHWSRLAWDLTSNAAAFAAAALLCGYRELGPGRAAALGVALGAGVGTHPSVTPLAAAVVLVVGLEAWRGSRRARLSGLLGLATLLAVTAPYLVYLLRARVVARAARLPLSAADLGVLALESPRLMTAWGLAYFFDGGWPDFLATMGTLGGLVTPLSAAALAAGAAATMAGLAAALASGDPRLVRLARVGALAWGGAVALLAAVGLERHPHYQFACAWVPVFGVAAALSWLRRRRARLGVAALVLLGTAAVAQFALIVRWMGFVREQGGSRGPTYGTPLGREVEAVRAACAWPEPRLVLRNDTAMYHFPFQYLATIEPACRGKTIAACAGGLAPLPKPCPPLGEDTRLVVLRYAGPKGGALAPVGP